MRRRSLSPIQARKLGRFIRQRREQQGFSIRGLASASRVSGSTVLSLERGDLLAPQPDTLRALATALRLPVSDLLTVAGWLPANELPTLKVYLRAQYQAMTEESIAKVEHQVAAELARRDHENSHPEQPPTS